MYRVCYRVVIWISLTASIALSAAGEFSAGQNISFFAWKRDAAQEQNAGYYGLTEITRVASAAADTIEAVTEIQGMPFWLELITSRFADTRLVIDHHKPATVKNCSQKYETCRWLRSVRLTLDAGERHCRFEFPLLNQPDAFNQYDYFTVQVNDSLDLQFHAVADSLLMGSFLNTQYRSDPDKWLCGKAAVRIRTDAATALGVRYIELDARYRDLLAIYTGLDIHQFDQNAAFFGVELLDTTLQKSLIEIADVRLSTTSALEPGYTYSITWDCTDAAVEHCSLFVSFDNAASWAPIARVGGADSSFSWTVPEVAVDSAYIEVRAYDGERRGAARSARFAIIPKPPFELRAQALSPYSVELRWNPAGIPADAQAFGVAWRSDSQPSFTQGPGDYDARTYARAASVDTVADLTPGKRYFFAAFIQNASGDTVLAGPGALDSVQLDNDATYARDRGVNDIITIQLQWAAGQALFAGSENLFRIPAKRLRHFRVSLFNLRGQRVWQWRASDRRLKPGVNTISMESVGAGAYVLRVSVALAGEGGAREVTRVVWRAKL